MPYGFTFGGGTPPSSVPTTHSVHARHAVVALGQREVGARVDQVRLGVLHLEPGLHPELESLSARNSSFSAWLTVPADAVRFRRPRSTASIDSATGPNGVTQLQFVLARARQTSLSGLHLRPLVRQPSKRGIVAKRPAFHWCRRREGGSAEAPAARAPEKSTRGLLPALGNRHQLGVDPQSGVRELEGSGRFTSARGRTSS